MNCKFYFDYTQHELKIYLRQYPMNFSQSRTSYVLALFNPFNHLRKPMQTIDKKIHVFINGSFIIFHKNKVCTLVHYFYVYINTLKTVCN